jgi:type IV secretory pathway VirJ component
MKEPLMRLFWLAVCALLLFPASLRSQSIEAGRMGNVPFIVPETAPHGLVFLFSDKTGWSAELDEAATAISRLGTVVAKIDLPTYLDRLRASDDGCHYLISEIEDASKRLQASLAIRRYEAPILAGTGMGAALAYAALAQSPGATIEGAASDGFDTVLDTKVPLCPGAAAARVPGGFSYAPVRDLPGWWRLAARKEQMASADQFYRDAGLNSGEIVVIREGSSTAERFVALLEEPIKAIGQRQFALSDLPITELDATEAGPYFAIIYSGDGGWRDLDKQIGEYLAHHGVPVVGIDCLRYFWTKKTPEQIADDLRAIIEHYRVKWHRDEVLLIGYSFGANILPFALSRLPERLRNRVRLVSLLGLSQSADFVVHVTGWLGADPGPDALPVMPELARIDLRKVQCVYGVEEKDSGCAVPSMAAAERIETPGGHHFGGDYAALARRILDGAQRREPSLPRR